MFGQLSKTDASIRASPSGSVISAQSRAALKGVMSDVGELGREGDLGQHRAAFEGIITDVCEPKREMI